jgi:HK97 family phage major capsid protein
MFNSFAEILIALKQYEKKGQLDSRLTLVNGNITTKNPSGQSEIVAVDGGYAVGGEVISPILHSISQKAVLWNKASKFYSSSPNVNTGYLPFVQETARTNTAINVRSYWPAEGAIKQEAKFNYGLATCKLNKIYSVVSVTDELWNDSAALQSSITQFVSSEDTGSLVWGIERAMLMGEGATSMYGIMGSDTNGTIGVAVPDPVVESTILNYMKALAPAAVASSAWYMSKENYNDVLDINWTNDVMTFENGQMYLYGLPVFVLEQMVAPFDLMLGDVSHYAVALKQGIQEKMSIHVKFLTDENTVRIGIRLNGKSFGSTYTLEDGTEVGTFVVPSDSPAQESTSSSSSSSTMVRSTSSSSSSSTIAQPSSESSMGYSTESSSSSSQSQHP